MTRQATSAAREVARTTCSPVSVTSTLQGRYPARHGGPGCRGGQRARRTGKCPGPCCSGPGHDRALRRQSRVQYVGYDDEFREIRGYADGLIGGCMALAEEIVLEGDIQADVGMSSNRGMARIGNEAA